MHSKTNISRSLDAKAWRRVGEYWRSLRLMGVSEGEVRRAVRDAERDEMQEVRRSAKERRAV